MDGGAPPSSPLSVLVAGGDERGDELSELSRPLKRIISLRQEAGAEDFVACRRRADSLAQALTAFDINGCAPLVRTLTSPPRCCDAACAPRPAQGRNHFGGRAGRGRQAFQGLKEPGAPASCPTLARISTQRGAHGVSPAQRGHAPKTSAPV